VKRAFGIPRRRWEDDIRLDLRELVWKDVNWFHVDQWWDLVITVMNLRFPNKAYNFLPS
jgi:hypothetical protein